MTAPGSPVRGMAGRRLVLLAALSLALAASLLPAAERRPNIVLIVADDLGYGDLSCYGGGIPTPHIDALAASGARFTDWYVTAPVCTPTRYSLLTGRYPHGGVSGALTFDHQGRIPADAVTLADLCKRVDYQTALIGKWHLGHHHPDAIPSEYGFEHFYGHLGGLIDYFEHQWQDRPDWQRNGVQIDEPGYATDLLTREAVGYIRAKARDRDPFFLYLPYNAPHYAQKPIRGRNNILQAKEQDIARFRHIEDADRRVYSAMVKALDDGVGEVLEALERKRIADETIVIFFSDNGGDPRYGGSNAPLRGGKHELWEGGIRTPCLIRWPGRTEPGSVIGRPAICTDLLPTLCRHLDIGIEQLSVDGHDIGPLLAGDAAGEPRALHWSSPAAGDAMRRGRWKLIKPRGGGWQLYDLHDDPQETTDLADQQQAVVEDMRQAHTAWRRQRPD